MAVNHHFLLDGGGGEIDLEDDVRHMGARAEGDDVRDIFLCQRDVIVRELWL